MHKDCTDELLLTFSVTRSFPRTSACMKALQLWSKHSLLLARSDSRTFNTPTHTDSFLRREGQCYTSHTLCSHSHSYTHERRHVHTHMYIHTFSKPTCAISSSLLQCQPALMSLPLSSGRLRSTSPGQPAATTDSWCNGTEQPSHTEGQRYSTSATSCEAGVLPERMQ